jgi:hypothetical protein
MGSGVKVQRPITPLPAAKFSLYTRTSKVFGYYPFMSSEEIYSINAAAKLTGYSLPTIRKRLPALKKAGAVQRNGVWNIPLSALHTVGLMLKVEGGNLPSKDSGEELTALLIQVAQLQAELKGVKALAAEREKALERMDRALLAIEGKPARKRWGLFS